jgi:hypothetical protein
MLGKLQKMFTAQEKPQFMAWETNLPWGREKECSQNKQWTCGCLEGPNAYGVGDGNIQGKGNAGGYSKNIYMLPIKED